MSQLGQKRLRTFTEWVVDPWTDSDDDADGDADGDADCDADRGRHALLKTN